MGYHWGKQPNTANKRSKRFQKLKSYKHLFQPQCSETRNQLEKKAYRKLKKLKEAKQYNTKQPMDHWRNQRRNQNIPGDKWNWKHNSPKSMELGQRSSEREVYSDNKFTPGNKDILK